MAVTINIPLSWRAMEAKWAGTCSECGSYVGVGSRIGYKPDTKAVRCSTCQDWAECVAHWQKVVAKAPTVGGKVILYLAIARGASKELADACARRRREDAHNATCHWRDTWIDLRIKPAAEKAIRLHRWAIDQIRSLRGS